MNDGEDVTVHFTANEIALLDEFAAQVSTPTRPMSRAEGVYALVHFALVIADRTAEREAWAKRGEPS